jgi:dsDNA-specific endonuclease/ATPase MutS2
MNAKLTLSLDRDTIENAKIFARSRHKSLSRMVENYLRQVTRAETSAEEITPLVAELSGVVSAESAERYGAEYADYLTGKYR